MMSSFSIWGCILQGYFERGIFWRAKSSLKGIEDFNLEHWLQAIPCGIPERKDSFLRGVLASAVWSQAQTVESNTDSNYK